MMPFVSQQLGTAASLAGKPGFLRRICQFDSGPRYPVRLGRSRLNSPPTKSRMSLAQVEAPTQSPAILRAALETIVSHSQRESERKK